MNAKDLMIGDWVNIQTEKDNEPMYSQVRQLSECDIDADFETSYDNVYPIPLTREILEKNGFGFIDTSNSEYSSIWTGWWILKGLELGCCDNSKFPVFFNIADTNVKVNYVHELQHALKLCGIEKEIVL